MKKHKKIIYLVSGVILILVILIFTIIIQDNKTLRVVFLDVGQGDAILIQTPYGQDILIDGGPGKKVIEGLSKYMPFWNRDIELMILSHPHSDHIQGQVEVLKRYKVKKVLGYLVDYQASDYLAWQNIIKEKEIPRSKTVLGESFTFGENLSLKTLHPFEDITGRHFEDVNDTSVVNMLNFGEISFLFTGDAPMSIEEELLKKGIDIEAEVLKAGHHGSKYSSKQEFLEKVKPRFVVIQSGKDNKYNHPHYITLKHLEKLGFEILRNDLVGNVVCESDGKEIWCK